MSPAGVRDVLRRLKSVNVITEARIGNKCLYSFEADDLEEAFLRHAISKQSAGELQNRAQTFSARSAIATSWIEETIEMVRNAKRSARHSA
jgi:predicted transcriptional regulator